MWKNCVTNFREPSFPGNQLNVVCITPRLVKKSEQVNTHDDLKDEFGLLNPKLYFYCHKINVRSI